MYNYKNSKQNVINILTSKTKIEDKDNIPHENEFTYENGVRCWTTAIFVDIRNSSALFTETNKDKLARFMRAFTSEIITILSQDDKHYQIGIRGDCVYGIYSSHSKKDDIRIFDYACDINTYIKMLNKISAAYGYKSISVGIGIGSGQDLIIKAGRIGSGINDKIYIGDALVYASNLCNIANTKQYNSIAIDKLVYANVVEVYPKYKQWLHFARDYSCTPNEFYHCNMITTDFDEWINGGMKNVYKAERSLLSIQEHINKFDNKANSLITIVGIIFAFSLGILDTFNQFVGVELTEKLQLKFLFLIAFSILYFISFALELIFLILVIYPRKKKEGKVSLTYYADVAELSKEEIKKLLQEDNKILEPNIDQISINAKICKQKHKFLVIAIWTLIPLFVFMFSVFFIAIF